MSFSLTFHGAAGTVTGSAILLTTPRGRLLLDCGLFQGPKSLQELNYRHLPFDPAQLDAIVISHAHMDHAGLFPRLVRAGFRGRALATPASCDLLRWMLPDSGAIQEQEVERLNRRLLRQGRAAVSAIYTRADAETALGRLTTQAMECWVEVLPGLRLRLRNAGHILGAAFVELEADAAPRALRLMFSGNIGPRHKSLQFDPAAPAACDIAIVESTYGDRLRPPLDEAGRRELLRTEIAAALAAGGNILIPAFAIERTQELLRDLLLLMREGELPQAQIFIDSPLATRATEVFARYRRELELPSEEKNPFSAANLHFTESVEQSKRINLIRSGAIIIAGSGMCEAGRIKHHLKEHLWRPGATVLFAGYQASGTLGATLRRGAARVRIHGEEIEVRARIRTLHGYSGHADQAEMVAWARPALAQIGTLFLVHGEAPALAGLAAAMVADGVPAARIIKPDLDASYALRFETDRWIAVSRRGQAARRLDRRASAELAQGQDWHNDYSEALLALDQRLQQAPDDRARRRLVAGLRRSLGLPERR